MEDIMYDYKETMLETILDFLETNDFDLLRGIQTFDSALDYTGVMGLESIMTVLFNESVNAVGESKEIREELSTNGTELYTMGLLEIRRKQAERLERRLIPFSRVLSALKGIRNAVENIETLRKLGLIDVERVIGEIETTYIRLSDMWDGIIDEIVREGKEGTVFGSAIGRILSVAINGKGFTSLIPLIHAYLIAMKKDGEISSEEFLIRCCPRVSRPHRFYTNLIERDRKKISDIQAFTYNNGQRMIMNASGIRCVQQWRTRANARSRERLT